MSCPGPGGCARFTRVHTQGEPAVTTEQKPESKMQGDVGEAAETWDALCGAGGGVHPSRAQGLGVCVCAGAAPGDLRQRPRLCRRRPAWSPRINTGWGLGEALRCRDWHPASHQLRDLGQVPSLALRAFISARGNNRTGCKQTKRDVANSDNRRGTAKRGSDSVCCARAGPGVHHVLGRAPIPPSFPLRGCPFPSRCRDWGSGTPATTSGHVKITGNRLRKQTFHFGMALGLQSGGETGRRAPGSPSPAPQCPPLTPARSIRRSR